MTVARLREILRDDPANPAVIVTVRAKGYMLVADGAEENTGKKPGATAGTGG